MKDWKQGRGVPDPLAFCSRSQQETRKSLKKTKNKLLKEIPQSPDRTIYKKELRSIFRFHCRNFCLRRGRQLNIETHVWVTVAKKDLCFSSCFNKPLITETPLHGRLIGSTAQWLQNAPPWSVGTLILKACVSDVIYWACPSTGKSRLFAEFIDSLLLRWKHPDQTNTVTNSYKSFA